MKIRANEEYYLHWSNNPSFWNNKLKELINNNLVEKINGCYYTKVTPHYSGKFDVVDCTCDKRGNFYPINTSLLKEI